MKERGRDGPVPSTDSKEASGLDKKKGSKNLTTVQETEEETEVGEQRGQGVTTLDKFIRCAVLGCLPSVSTALGCTTPGAPAQAVP